MLPFRIAAAEAQAGLVMQALVDTGADCTLVPQATARALGLPTVGAVWIKGVGGAVQRAPLHAARVEFAGIRCLARLIALGEEAILGRDLLNRVILQLDGPDLTLSLQRPPRRRGGPPGTLARQK